MDDASRAFINLEYHTGESFTHGGRDVVADDHIRIPLLFVLLGNLVLRAGKLNVIHGIAHLDLDGFTQLVAVKSRVA